MAVTPQRAEGAAAADPRSRPRGRRLRADSHCQRGSKRVFIVFSDHGYPDNLQIWCELAPRLAEHPGQIRFVMRAVMPDRKTVQPWPVLRKIIKLSPDLE
jgi:hypothetical protein